LKFILEPREGRVLAAVLSGRAWNCTIAEEVSTCPPAPEAPEPSVWSGNAALTVTNAENIAIQLASGVRRDLFIERRDDHFGFGHYVFPPETRRIPSQGSIRKYSF
jgi:hypothetical protein